MRAWGTRVQVDEARSRREERLVALGNVEERVGSARRSKVTAWTEPAGRGDGQVLSGSDGAESRGLLSCAPPWPMPPSRWLQEAQAVEGAPGQIGGDGVDAKSRAEALRNFLHENT
jgi:hypothetical protein